MKRIMTVLSVILVFFVGLNIAQAQTTDIKGHYAEKEMLKLNEIGVMLGDGKGSYFPERDVTRAEFAAFVARALNLPDVTEMNEFPDVPQNHSLRDEIYQAAAANIVAGYPDGTFQPNKQIPREEMAVMIDRALKNQGIENKTASLNFIDSSAIHSDYRDEVANVVAQGIIIGDKENQFRPKENTIRADAAIVIYRLLSLVDPDAINEAPNYEYNVAKVNSDGSLTEIKKYPSYADAKNAATSNNLVVRKNNKILWMKSGIVRASGYTVVYNDATTSKGNKTYVSTNTEMKYVETTNESWVKIEVAGIEGYVQMDKIVLMPNRTIQNRSYYTAKSGELIHYIYDYVRQNYVSFVYGKAPSFMSEGQKYFSWDGSTFTNASGKTVGNVYQYFNYMPLYTKTSYTAAQLDSFVKNVYTPRNGFSKSPLEGLGSAFKKAESNYGINALYLLAHAIHESDWGTSKIAQDKKNLFGLGAGDSDPYKLAYTFPSFEEGILEAARAFIIPGYFVETHWKYNGAFLGNKAMGMNVRYASDPFWGEKIAGLMYRADKFLGSKELNKYRLAVTLKTNTNVRSNPIVNSSTVQYQLPKIGTTVQVLNEVKKSNEIWYQISPKNITYHVNAVDENGNPKKDKDGNQIYELYRRSYDKSYVYSHGNSSYGTNFKLIPLAGQ